MTAPIAKFPTRARTPNGTEEGRALDHLVDTICSKLKGADPDYIRRKILEVQVGIHGGDKPQ